MAKAGTRAVRNISGIVCSSIDSKIRDWALTMDEWEIRVLFDAIKDNYISRLIFACTHT